MSVVLSEQVKVNQNDQGKEECKKKEKIIQKRAIKNRKTGTKLYRKIFMQHIFLNYSIVLNTSGFKLCSFNSMN